MTGPIEVVHVMWRLSPGGGVQTVVRSLIAAVDPARVHLTVVTARPRIDSDELDALPVGVVGLGHQGDRVRLYDRVRLAVTVARQVRRTQPDVVQLHSGTVWLGVVARLVVRKTAFVVEVHDAPGSGRHGRPTDLVEGWWSRLSRATVVCLSSSVADAVRRRWNIRRDRIVVFPLSVDLDQFESSAQRRGATRDRLGIAPEAVVLLAVGRMVPSKRFDLAVEAFAKLGVVTPTVLLLIGDGPNQAAVVERARELGLGDRVLAPGNLPRADLVDTYFAADILVSTSEYEGFGLTLVEGMAAGLPVVATAVGGVTDIVVDAETGRLVVAGDEAALVRALRVLVENSGLRAAMGRAGRARAEECYSQERLASAFTAVYERVGGARR